MLKLSNTNGKYLGKLQKKLKLNNDVIIRIFRQIFVICTICFKLSLKRGNKDLKILQR